MEMPSMGLSPGLSLADLVERRAASSGAAAAFIIDDRTVTFAELNNAVRRAAAGLRRLGVGPGERVGLWLPNCIEWIELFLACARIGAIAVTVNTRYGPTELSDVLGRSGARILVIAPDVGSRPQEDVLAHLDRAETSGLETLLVVGRPGVPTSRLAGWPAITYEDLHRHPPDRGPAVGTAESEVVIFMTSGTTRRPKLVTHTQRSLVDHGHDVAVGFGLDQTGAVALVLHPLFGVLGLTQMMAALASGALTVMPSHFEAVAVATAMRRYHVTSLTTLDQVLAPLLDAVDEPFPDLRFIGFGADDSSPVEFARNRLEPRGIHAVGTYGMSEVQATIALQPLDAPLETRVLGGGALVRVCVADSSRRLPHDAVGELQFRCPSLMSRYYGDPEATAAAFTEDGFLRSGDAGTLMADGSFRLLGRIGDALRLSGFLVNPVEISDFVTSHPAVRECQVVGVRTDRGLRPVAFVIPAPGTAFSETALADHCALQLAVYKRPVRFIPVDSFPMAVGPNGQKVQRGKLREMAEEVMV
jgi:fatty-acyl-CoA synthase